MLNEQQRRRLLELEQIPRNKRNEAEERELQFLRRLDEDRAFRFVARDPTMPDDDESSRKPKE
jgi:hypothetical protein